MKKLLVALTMAIGALACMPGTGRAAGFDCSKARTATEKAICGNASLSEADERMARAYRSLPRAEREALAPEQKAWLVKRELTCAEDVACLRKMTVQRAKWAEAWRVLAAQAEPHRAGSDLWSDDGHLYSICSARYGIFDIRIPQGNDDALQGLDDAYRYRILEEGDYSAEEYYEAASMACELPGGLRIDVKYQQTPYRSGRAMRLCVDTQSEHVDQWTPHPRGRAVSERRRLCQ